MFSNEIFIIWNSESCTCFLNYLGDIRTNNIIVFFNNSNILTFAIVFHNHKIPLIKNVPLENKYNILMLINI